MNILKPELFFNNSTGQLSGNSIGEKTARIADLKGIFADEAARAALPQDMLAYHVQYYFPVAEGTEGGLFFGNTTIYPGKVGDEYFMTKGHFHAKGDRGEYYWCIQGQGVLLYMDRDRKTWAKEMTPGSLHYMPAHVAHRTVNVGNAPMTFGACWPSDAGHDYGTILHEGFSARLVERNGKPALV
ncbi:MAG: cupin domain-containing protein [Cyclobacteriaceae bacterium]|nr:cupin domain-containing protein [Cyclobacteriaceae bacterium]